MKELERLNQPSPRNEDDMKPAPAPHVPGNTEFERFDNAVRMIFTVSKEELLKREAKWKRTRARKKRAKKLAMTG